MLGGYFEECKKILQKLHFEVIRNIGKGSFGHVLLASKFSSSIKYYAIKCISLKKCAKDPNLKRNVAEEIKAMSAVDHSNVIRYIDSFVQSGWHFIVMEYCDRGTLIQFQAKKATKKISRKEALKILEQIISGVSAIHRKNIIHRDIKCENIFLSSNEVRGYICKIGDFGFAKNNSEIAKTACGTVGFMAPEVMNNGPYSFEADIWSIGVVFYYLLFGQPPFKTLNIEKDILTKCSKGFNLFQLQPQLERTKFELNLSTFFAQTFQLNPNKRIGLQQMLKHSIFNPEVETTSDSTNDDQFEQQIEWELNRVTFIIQTLQQILQTNILEGYLRYALKFYLLKVCRIFLSEKIIKTYVEQQPNSKLSSELNHKLIFISEGIQSAYNSLLVYRTQTKQISRFKEGFNLDIQDFKTIKEGYRNTIGQVFEEIHEQIKEPKSKALLKFRVFCCHLINRVFKSGVQQQVFPNFGRWLQENKKQKTGKQIDFNYLNEWMMNEKPENLLSEISNINKIFYQKS